MKMEKLTRKIVRMNAGTIAVESPKNETKYGLEMESWYNRYESAREVNKEDYAYNFY